MKATRQFLATAVHASDELKHSAEDDPTLVMDNTVQFRESVPLDGTMALAATVQWKSTKTLPTPARTEWSDGAKDRMSAGTVAGIIIGVVCVAVVAAIVVAVVLMFRGRARNVDFDGENVDGELEAESLGDVSGAEGCE
jgi:hypothetical protein